MLLPSKNKEECKMVSTNETLRQALSRGNCGLELTALGQSWQVVNARITASCCGDSLIIGAVTAAQLIATVTGTGICCGDAVTLTALVGEQRLPLGCYWVSVCKAEGGRSTLTAYDAAFDALNEAYLPSTSQPPRTVLAVLRDLCSQCGLTLGDVSGLTDRSVSGDLEGRTCKSMAGYMAALLGCNVVVDRSGSLSLRGFSAGRSIGTSDYYNGGLQLDETQTLVGLRMVKRVTVTATDSDGITTQTEQRDVYEAGSGSGVVIEVENPFATQAIADAVWAGLHNAVTTYRTGSCAFFGGLETEPGDLVAITDDAGNTCTFPALTVVTELDGGCKTTISAAGLGEIASAETVQGESGRQLSRLTADLGVFQELTAQNFAATEAKVDNLYADQAWVQNLFSQQLTAGALDVTGSSRFSGIIDATVAKIGGVRIGEPDVSLTQTATQRLGVTVDWVQPHPTPSEPLRLISVGIAVERRTARAERPEYTVTLGTYPGGGNSYLLDTSGLQFDQAELVIPVNSNAFNTQDRVFSVRTAPTGSSGWSRLQGAVATYHFYYGAVDDLSADGAIRAGTQLYANGQRVRANIATEGIDQSTTVLADSYAVVTFDYSSILSGYPSDAIWYPAATNFQGAYVLAANWWQSGNTVHAVYRNTASWDITGNAQSIIVIFS